MKVAAIFRVPGDNPPMDTFAQGTFANGYLNELIDPWHFNPAGAPDVDLVAVCGGLPRYDNNNQKIFDHYRGCGIPVIIVEFSWLKPDHVFTYLNGAPWVPPVGDRARRIREGFTVEYRPRGETVLVIGQGPEDDERLLAPAVAEIAKRSGRRIRYRQHPNAKRRWPHITYKMPNVHEQTDHDTIEGGQQSLEADLDDAWCVVTASSNVGHSALLRGIPVIASRSAAFAEVSHELSFTDVDALVPRKQSEVEAYFDRMVLAHWSYDDIRTGVAMRFLGRCL